MSIQLQDFIVDKNDLLKYEENRKTEAIPFSSIGEYWEYATSVDFESGSAYVDGSLIIGFITVASGQDGVVFVWNTANHKIEHITKGAYTISVLLHGNTVYNLCCVMNYTTPAHFMLYKSRLGTKDVSAAADIVEFNCSCSIDEYNGRIGSVKLMADNMGLFIMKGDNRYPIELRNDLNKM